MPTTSNAPQPRITRVCAEATTPEEHAGCSGGFCECTCGHPAAPEPSGPADGRWVAPKNALEQMRAVRDARRAKRRGGGR